MFRFASDVRQVKLIDCIRAINEDDEIHGALVFMPLPKNLDEDAVRNALDPRKDLDGISDGALAGMIADELQGLSSLYCSGLHRYAEPLRYQDRRQEGPWS
jgi:methylenetetrahydrofolate dehydrogenase (NADP+)/methenyltetrahydrofolate cyclohydrolase